MKTCLISQLNYIGCFLPMPEASAVNIQRLIDGFVKKKLPVAANRLYLPAELGGLGIFDIKTFFQAQHCSWIARAVKMPIDNWRFDLRAAALGGNILHIRPSDIDPTVNPILHNICVSFENFYREYCKKNGNYREAYIFSNPSFTRGPDTLLKLDQHFFGNNFNPAIRTLIFCNCFTGDRIKTRDEFREDGIELTAARWMWLQTALISARNRLRKNDDSDTNCETIENFFMHLKKGSKKFRSILELGKKAMADTLNLRTVTTFSNLANVELPPLPPLKKCLGLWNSNWINCP